MADLYVILTTPLVGPGIDYIAGDQYPVVSQEQGDLMVERDMAMWPVAEKVSKKTTTKTIETVSAATVEATESATDSTASLVTDTAAATA